MKFHIIVYGCQMNYADSARIKAVLRNCGFEYTENISDADIVILDTCSVRQKSEDKVFGKLKKIPKDKKVWITWCMIQHNLNLKKVNKLEETVKSSFEVGNFQGQLETNDPIITWLEEEDINDILYKFKKQNNPDEIKKFALLVNNAFNPLYKKLKKNSPNLELMFRIDDLWYLPKILNQIWYQVPEDQNVTNEYTGILPVWANQISVETNNTAYIPIQTGCNQFCAYCIVPFARWFEKNRPVEEILDEVKYHIQAWAKEIVLVGQIVNKHPNFNHILKEILKLDWFKWLRYTSPYPTYYDNELLELHAKEERLCPHIHIPAQSGSNKILKKMFRWYTAEQFKEFIDKINSLPRDISITTDFIIWFPDETEEDFEKSLELVKYWQFDMIFMWIYSPRPGTIGARKYEDNIPQNTKSARWTRMNEILKEISYNNNQKDIGQNYDVIVTKKDKDAIWYNKQFKNIVIKNPEKATTGEFHSVNIYDANSFNLFGKIND